LIGPFITEFFIILSAGDVRKTPEEIVVVMITCHLSDAHHIVHTLARVLKMIEECEVGIL